MTSAAAGRLWRLYQTSMKARPALTQCITSGVLWACGDSIAQSFSEEEFNGERVLQMSLYGFALYGPVLMRWFRRQERWFPGNSTRAVATKVAVHTAVMAPLTVAGTIAYAGVTQRRPKEEVLERIRERTLPVYLAGAIFWVPFNLANYRFVAVESRLLASNGANLLWTSYLSYKAHLSKQNGKA